MPGTTGDYKTMYLKDLKESDHLSLVDAGTLFNSPYPLVLHPDRKIDLILSFDFSKRDEDNTSPFGVRRCLFQLNNGTGKSNLTINYNLFNWFIRTYGYC